MIKSMLSKTLKRIVKRSESGQSLIIIALGFLGLLAFVGIVTDVSLMFVRFSQLTRAVDSASIAAAGQVRRAAPNQQELNDAGGVCATLTPETMYQAYDPADPNNCVRKAQEVAFARSFANVGIAARQFIEFYGLQPNQVVVDMCATVSKVESGVLVPIVPELQDDFDQLCTEDQRKLIRVTAQIESPTVFLSLLGWGNILLQASSLSETAVLDVVLIMDVSESMSNRTTYTDWADNGYPFIYMPPAVDYFDITGAAVGGWVKYSGARAAALDPRYSGGDGFTNFWQDMVQDNASIGGNAQDEVNALVSAAHAGGRTDSPYYYWEFRYPGTSGGTRPREECRVRFHPASIQRRIPTRDDPSDPAANLVSFWTTASGGAELWANHGGASYGAFVPTYDYFGCCNDPNGDLNFGDLLCQPFKEARDATERFLHRIDFFRGDRVSFVTFDRRAYIMYVDPDGPGGSDVTHMLESEALAVDTLQRYVGVRAERSFYEPSQVRNYDNTEIGVMPWIGTVNTAHDYPVYSSCPFQDAALAFPYSAVSAPYAVPAPINHPDALRAGMYPRGTGWSTDINVTSYKSYDLWASCGGGNIGAALRDANDALLRQRTRRTEGAVWVMVMISDGAAGVSDPVKNGGGHVIPDPIDYPYTRQGFQVTYGGFGVCPAGDYPGSGGSPDKPDLVDLTEGNSAFPFCTDELPETRHFCFDPVVTTPNDLDVASFPNCEKVYDADDYARDWADFVTGIRNINQESQAGLSQLPTIFTIGFGFNFDAGVASGRPRTTECSRGNITRVNALVSDLDDCLGEELLRYIADVGDNFTIDTDYQQAYRNGNLYTDVADYGPRGPCEQDLDPASATSIEDLVLPLRAGDSCGNYFNAPDETQLDDVFDEIASRMFTRLTR